MPKDQELKPILEDQKAKKAAALQEVSEDTSGGNPAAELPLDEANDKSSSACCPCLEDRAYCGAKWSHVILTILNVLTAVVALITLPVCLAGLDRVDSDAYPIIYITPFANTLLCFFVSLPTKIFCKSGTKWSYKPENGSLVLLMGGCNLLYVVLQTYSALPSRTPAHLQIVCSTVFIPCTVLFRYLILSEAGIQKRQWACIGVVIFGLLITLIPQFIAFDQPPDMDHPFEVDGNLVKQEEAKKLPLYARVLWPIAYTLAFIPFSLSMVLAEKILKREEENPIVLSMYVQLITFIGGAAFFWTDIIPGWGMAHSVNEFSVHQRRAVQCMFGYGTMCDYLTSRIWMFMFANGISFIIQMLLIRYAEGAIYSVLVLALVMPLGTMFWALVDDNSHYGKLIWEPEFETSSIFSLSGLLILIPPVALYDYFGLQAKRQSFQRL